MAAEPLSIGDMKFAVTHFVVEFPASNEYAFGSAPYRISKRDYAELERPILIEQVSTRDQTVVNGIWQRITSVLRRLF
jgi:hypothetical protein